MLCLTVDALAGGATVVHCVIQGTLTIEQYAHQPTFLPIEVFDATSALGELVMRTGLACALRKEQGTAKTLSTVAVGVLEEKDRIHAQAFGAVRSAIGITRHLVVPMRVERDGSNAFSMRHRLIDIPIVVGGVSSNMVGY